MARPNEPSARSLQVIWTRDFRQKVEELEFEKLLHDGPAWTLRHRNVVSQCPDARGYLGSQWIPFHPSPDESYLVVFRVEDETVTLEHLFRIPPPPGLEPL